MELGKVNQKIRRTAPVMAESSELPGIAVASINTARQNSSTIHSAFSPRGPAIPTKNKHRYGWLLLRSHRSFTVVVSVFRGTPLPKPLDCKIRDNQFGESAGLLKA